jgi:solute:Na+ symporter, SSS family
MHWLDLTLLGAYFLFVLSVGLYFFRRQRRVDEYFVGDRGMGAGHIGLSVVATDVGGGFSIGLGGLGFAMGLAGSWLLFTGLVGAWLAAVLLIPRVWRLGREHGMLTYPDYLEHRFDRRTRLVAALVSAVGYAGFVGSQILAGAKLSSAAFAVDQTTAVWCMAIIVVGYTALGGLQAVVFTDTIQWGVLLGGLLLFALPFGWAEVGGWQGLRAALPAQHFDLFAVDAATLLTWMFTIVPIWFVGMTLYQRIYATRDERTAQRAWLMAGLLEWPLMAFVGVLLGMMGRVLFPTAEPEMGLPLLVREVLPVGVKGVVLAAYFSAIMSTADSCLLASVGNAVNDIYQQWIRPSADDARVLTLSRNLTVLIGFGSVGLALAVPKVLDAIVLAYGFMVSGLFAPTLGGLLWPRVSSTAALSSMLAGGGALIALTARPAWNPAPDPILLALPLSALTLVVVTLLRPARGADDDKEAT